MSYAVACSRLGCTTPQTARCIQYLSYERFNWMAHAVSLARTSGDDYLIAFSGGTDHELNGFLNFAVKRTTLGGLKIVKFVDSTQAGRGSGEADLESELDPSAPKSYAAVLKQANFSKVGSDLCSEKKILSYCAAGGVGLREIVTFCNGDSKFKSYFESTEKLLTYLRACESCDSAYGDFRSIIVSHSSSEMGIRPGARATSPTTSRPIPSSRGPMRVSSWAGLATISRTSIPRHGLYVIELGSGTGRFAFHFLRSLLAAWPPPALRGHPAPLRHDGFQREQPGILAESTRGWPRSSMRASSTSRSSIRPRTIR